eukprot:364330-Chlamydomonas_euryale.AAC.3
MRALVCHHRSSVRTRHEARQPPVAAHDYMDERHSARRRAASFRVRAPGASGAPGARLPCPRRRPCWHTQPILYREP